MYRQQYDFSDEGYFEHLVHVLSEVENNTEGDASDSNLNGISKRIFSDVDTIMIVGHNPAIEKLLNKLLLSSSNDKVKEWQHYSPGHFYAMRFPTLERWSDLRGYIREGMCGTVELHLPE